MCIICHIHYSVADISRLPTVTSMGGRLNRKKFISMAYCKSAVTPLLTHYKECWCLLMSSPHFHYLSLHISMNLNCSSGWGAMRSTALSQYPKRRLFVRSREYQSQEICTLNRFIALKFDRHIGSNATEVPVKFQSDLTILNTNVAASRLEEILRKDVFSDIETGPRMQLRCST